ncbi:DUF6086 family protein [Amycolatopsis sp. NPDC102389]|uniref:DUF6086 family protein n=1 Tax=Amycolatopsis sp. NPDC102389 TaxID=3363941 RepID=UPI00382CB9F2
MSQYFQVGDRVLWNPSNGVSQLFLRSAEALAPVVDLPTGIGAMVSDECEIDMKVFEVFVNALVQRYRQSTHPILRSLMEGFVATALVMVERGRGSVPALDAEPGPDVRDISLGHDGIGARARPERLAELCADHSRAMPY